MQPITKLYVAVSILAFEISLCIFLEKRFVITKFKMWRIMKLDFN